MDYSVHIRLFPYLSSTYLILPYITICTGSKGADFLSFKELKVGEIVNIFGIPFFLYDCDKHTRDFYIEEFGWEFNPIQVDGLKEYAPPTAKRVSIPPQ